MKRTDSNGNFVTISKAVKEVWRELPINYEFHGWELQERCISKYPELKNAYTDTFLRTMRKFYCGSYQIKKHSESLYVKVAE